MTALRNTFQHYCNPLHVYCRLRGLGMSGPAAHWLSRLYERVFYV